MHLGLKRTLIINYTDIYTIPKVSALGNVYGTVWKIPILTLWGAWLNCAANICDTPFHL